MLILLAIAAFHALGAVLDMAAAVRLPVELDYGEGIVWQQAALIPGPLMYGTGTELPFIVFHYPPMFHLLVRAALGVQPDFLAAGRLVSALATLSLVPMVASLVLLCAPRGLRASWSVLGVALIAGLLLLGLFPVRNWSTFMRVDMAGLAFGYAGLLVAAVADGRFRGTILALLLCLAAVFTKQTLITFGIAVSLLAVLHRPRDALLAIAIVACIGVTMVLGLQHATDGGFLQHIVGYNINRLDLAGSIRVITGNLDSLSLTLLMLLLAIWLAGTILPCLARWQPRLLWQEISQLRHGPVIARRQALLLLQLMLAGLMLFTLLKSGGWTNYLLDWCCAACTAGGAAMVLMARAGGITRQHLNLVLTALIMFVVAEPFRLTSDDMPAAEAGLYSNLIERIRKADRPVSSENMVLLMQSGRGIVYEPAIVTELAALERWDEAPLVGMIRNHGFAFMLTSNGTALPNSRRSPAVTKAMLDAYPRVTPLTPGLWLREEK